MRLRPKQTVQSQPSAGHEQLRPRRQLRAPGRVPAVELLQRGGRMQSDLPSRPAAARGWLGIRRTILPRTLIGSVHMDGTARRCKTRLPAAFEARHRTTPIGQLIEVEQGLNLTYDLSPE